MVQFQGSNLPVLFCVCFRFDVAIGYRFGCDPITVLAASFNLFDSIALVSPVPGIKPLRSSI